MTPDSFGEDFLVMPYSLPSFLRNCPNRLLARYFEATEPSHQPDWSVLGEAQTKPIIEALDRWSQDSRTQAELDFRDVHSMATEGGVQELLEEGAAAGVDFGPAFGELDSDHARALWVLLEHRDVFRLAELFYRADGLRGRSWRKHDKLPDGEPDTSEDAHARLAADLSAYYQKREGRGRACKVEYHRRGGRHYWFVYVQDYARATVGFDQSGSFERTTSRPAFELVFVHTPQERTLDLYAKGHRQHVARLASIWARAVLGTELDAASADRVVYELDGLLDPSFEFVTDPVDGVQEVRLRSLRLTLPGSKRSRITLEGEGTEETRALVAQAIQVVGGVANGLHVTQAGFQLVFVPEPGKRPKTRAFTVTYPNSCSLKYEPRDEVARKYLKQWGIDVS